mgnify:FL=1
MSVKTIHYVGFRDDAFKRAYRIFGGPVFIHRFFDARVFTDVGDDDVVIFGDKYKYTDYVYDDSFGFGLN